MNGRSGAPGERVGEDVEKRLFSILRTLLKEVQGRAPAVHAASRLDRDLGFDSLARVELVMRLERAFAVSLPESLLAEAETPRQLLAAIVAAGGNRRGADLTTSITSSTIASRGVPTDAQTLMDVLKWHGEGSPDRVCIQLLSGDDQVTPITCRDLYDDARRLAAGLRARGIAPGQAVALMLPTGREFLAAFFGTLLAGAVPAPLYPPVRRSALEEHARRQAAILNNCAAPLFIAMPEVLALAPLLKGLAPALEAVVTPSELAHEPGGESPARADTDLAFLQYTSGSTGDPKGVMLTHANLLANIRAMGEAVAVQPEQDVFVSWLPLYHDMGLIGACLGSLYYGMPLVLMSPLTFLARPARWLQAIHRYRGTLSAGPNFAYELCATKIDDADLAGLDLGSWRVAFNGAEQVSAETLRRFTARYVQHGFRAEALAPVYGLAESSVGRSFPPLGRGPVVDHIERAILMRDGVAAPLPAPSAAALAIVGCGRALPGHELRVVDARGRSCDERREGRVQFRGPSSCQGYYRNPAATARLLQDDWLDSGDRGYLVDGELFITGRVKDIIIRGGHNIYPYELEEAGGALAGVRQGGVAAFASRDDALGTERLVIVAETRERRPPVREQLCAAINEAVTGELGNPPDEVVLAPPRAVFATGALAAIGGFSLLPALRARQRWCRVVARITAAVGGIRLAVEGMEHMSGVATRVVVANHASYLDALLLVAVLPAGLHYVTKRELAARPLVGWCLGRSGCVFVERFDAQQGAAAARDMEAQVRAGASLLFFPVGTFGPAPGLRPFRMGAFVAAAHAGVSVVPVGLCGTRALLRAGSWRPRRGRVAVIVGAPLLAVGADWRAAVALRDRVRSELARLSGEPELHSMMPVAPRSE